MKGVKSRTVVIGVVVLLVAAFLAYAFWPRATAVDIAAVERGHMMVTVDEEARTRVRDAYVISAPVSGRLLRVDVEPGDAVDEGTVVARMTPARPQALDVRTEEQAKAAVEAAQAALALARAEVRRAEADAEYASKEIERARALRETEWVAQAALDRAERAWRTANAALETARAAVAMREAELENARAMLISPSEAERLSLSINPHPREAIPLNSPVSGRVLRVMQESETVLSAGAPILEIGDPSDDLEIVAELLSTDAVGIAPGDRVIIDKWGGGDALEGRVQRIEPWGFTKVSALGVEEQRVNVIIRFAGNPAERAQLGHGFRTEVRIVTWEDDEALKVPASATFRSGENWAVFMVVNGRARLADIRIGHNNGVEAEVLGGLEEGDRIILYPGSRIAEGARVKQREVEG